MELINTTNEPMVVEVEVVFCNDEIAESFADTIHLEPGETVNKDWVTKMHGTRNNSLVSVGLKIKIDGRAFLTSIKDDAVWKQFIEYAAAEGDNLSAARLKEIAAKVSKAEASPY